MEVKIIVHAKRVAGAENGNRTQIVKWTIEGLSENEKYGRTSGIRELSGGC